MEDTQNQEDQGNAVKILQLNRCIAKLAAKHADDLRFQVRKQAALQELLLEFQSSLRELTRKKMGKKKTR
jgi:hypothetical protein